MNAVLNPLSPLKALLNEIIRTDDATRLAECLQGKYLPAIGGHEYPAGILHRALSLPPIQPELPAHLAALLAILCFRRAQILAEDLEVSKLASASAAVTRAGAAGGTSPDLLDDEPYVFNLFLFATYLPPNDRLFEALKVFYQIGLNTKVLLSGGGRAARQLRQALTFQQVDASMEEHWLGLIHREISGPLKAEERSNFLDCWTALLWIPPSPADRDAGRTLTIERVEKGLLALHKASGDIEGLPILRYAVRQLSEAYPRSPEFWARQLGGRMKVWPELLRMVVVERWPILAAEDTGTDDLIPEDAREVWRALGAKEQAAVRMAAAAGDRDGWLKHWTDLVFTPPNIGLPPQQTLQQLQLIRASFEANFPGLDIEADWSGEETHAVEEEDVANTRRRMPYRHTSRFVSFERVSKVMAVIQQLLQRGDLSRARKFLEDQIRLQEADGTEPELIVKTLSNAAAGSLEHRHIKWAEELYNKAITYSVNDPIPHNGLAEVLKAKGDLAGAETLYREIISRWPENVVAHNGLAEVLKAKDDLAGAETLYRETISRWPENVVAHNGLAEVLKAKDDLAGAETLYREIISRWPENVVAHTGLAEILKAKDDLAGAETLYRETISRWPENVVAHNGLAEVLKAKDDLAGAETLYREIISRWPHDVVAPNGFANVLRKQRRFTDALASLPESTRLMSQQDFINLHLRGMILLESGDVEAAIDAFERGLASSPWACQQAYFRSALVVAKLREQHYREALQQLDALRESKPEFHTLRLHALAGEGEEQRARELHTELTAKLLVFRRPIRATIRCLDDAYGLTSATILRQPTPSQLDGIISAEVDMLLAA
jgi:tetratricopeptide (TPR) repeat protein